MALRYVAIWQPVRDIFGHFPLLPACAAVGAVVGCVLYFIWPASFWGEPRTEYVGAILLCAVFVYAVLRRWIIPQAVFLFILFASLFFAVAQHRTEDIAQRYRVLDVGNKLLWVKGVVEDIETTPERTRLTLTQLKIWGPFGLVAEAPRKIRLSAAAGRVLGVEVGSVIATQARLNPPYPPAFAGDYDMRFPAFFSETGASGLIMGEAYVDESTPPPTGAMIWLNALRLHLQQRMVLHGTPEQAVGAAFFTGRQELIPQAVRDDFQFSGLSHLLAISGMNLALVAGLVFLGLRRFIAWSWPWLALHGDIKKIAAIAAWVVCVGYAALAGFSLPTLRGLIMITLLFAAILLQRFRMSMRALCVAVIIILALWPESVMTASFQLSFAATLALVLWFNVQHEKELEPQSRLKIIQTLSYTHTVWATSLVAGLATMPLVAAHFGQVSPIGFFANVVAVPLTGLVVMPLGLMTLALIPLGLESIMLPLFGHASSVLIAVAHYFADLPFKPVAVDVAWVWGLGLLCSALVVFYITQKMRLFWAGVAVMIVGLFYVPRHVGENNLIALHKGKTILLETQNKHYAVVQLTDDKLEQRALERFARHTRSVLDTQVVDDCAEEGCVFSLSRTQVVVLPVGVSATPEDCRQNVALLAENTTPDNCPNALVPSLFVASQSRPWEKPLAVDMIPDIDPAAGSE